MAMSIAAVEGRAVEPLVPKRFSPRRQSTLLKAAQRGVHSPDKPQLLRTTHYRQTADEKRRYHELEKKRNKRAHDLGIDPTIIDRIFNPLFTTKSNGMGMDLAICRSIIEGHDGRLWASAGAEGGSVFQFVLPANIAR